MRGRDRESERPHSIATSDNRCSVGVGSGSGSEDSEENESESYDTMEGAGGGVSEAADAALPLKRRRPLTPLPPDPEPEPPPPQPPTQPPSHSLPPSLLPLPYHDNESGVGGDGADESSDSDANKAESESHDGSDEQEQGKDREKQSEGGTRISVLATLKALHDGVLRVLGRFLRFILHLDMHGGNTGDNPKFVEGLIDFIGGSLGGAAQVYVSQPLDTVKVKMQTFPESYRGMFDCFLSTYRKDGIFHGLYAGSVPAVVANVAENSVLFAAYGGCQKFVTFLLDKETTTELTTFQNAFAGSLAAFFSTLTLCPTELIKCKLQALREMKHFVSEQSQLRTPWSLTRYIWRTEGIRGFYRGLSSTFVREMPGYFFFFGSYEGTRELLRKEEQTKDQIGPIKTMVAGAVGGVCLWTSTFPADVIKSRIQVKNLDASMIAVGKEIVRNEGVLALYRGLLPSVLRTIPATATLFVVYEYSKKVMLGLL